MVLVVGESKVGDLEVADILNLGVEIHAREFERLAAELETDLREVVVVDMSVSDSMDELASLEVCDLCHHHKEEGIGGDVKWHAKENVGGTLVELERERAIGDIELEEAMTRWKSHLINLSHIPR